MKWIPCFLMGLFSLSSCSNQEQEAALQKKEAALNQKEQELIIREKNIRLKEDSLLRQLLPDSSRSRDTTHLVNAALTGSWNVRMTCIEASCPGSAVGDQKEENWQLSYQARTLIAKARFNNELIRIYSGFYTGNTIELVEARDSSLKVKMIVRLRLTDEAHLEGQREITRENCKVIYDLKMEKIND